MAAARSFDRRTPPAEMLRRRRAWAERGEDFTVDALESGEGFVAFRVISRDATTRYRVQVWWDGGVTCDCKAGQNHRPCFHAALSLARVHREGIVIPKPAPKPLPSHLWDER